MRRSLLVLLPLLLTCCEDADRVRALKRQLVLAPTPANPESCDPADAYLESGREPALSRSALPPDAHFEVLPGVVLPAAVAARVTRLDESYARRTGKHLTIVSGTRDPARQARAMVRVMQLGQSLTRLYGDREAAAEIQQAYRRALDAGKSADEVVAAVQAQLQDQIKRGVYISAHLRAGAFDVRNTAMTEADKKAFRAAARGLDDMQLIEEHRPPHFHLEVR